MMLNRRTKIAIAAAAGIAVLGGVGVAVAASRKSETEPEPEPESTDDAPPIVIPELPDDVDLELPDDIPPLPGETGDDDDDEQPPPVTIPPIVVSPPVTPPVSPPVSPPVTIPPIVVRPPVSPPVSPPVVKPPPVVTPVPDTPVPPDTAEMVAALLADERRPGWKRESSAVKAWQTSRGLAPDGKFGPKTALRIALEVGTIPIVRFWPVAAGRNPQAALEDYRSGLLTIGRRVGGQHELLLQQSATREQGQAFGPPTGDGGRASITTGFGGAA